MTNCNLTLSPEWKDLLGNRAASVASRDDWREVDKLLTVLLAFVSENLSSVGIFPSFVLFLFVAYIFSE